MATVYTESVVTLNAAQAEATMNSLKSSADELRRKMIDATKLGDTDDAAKYQKQLDNVNKSMQGIRKETKDYSEIMKKLNGSSLNELAKAYSGLNRQIKNLVPGTQEFIEKSNQLKQVKARMDEINSGIRSTNKTLDSLKGLLPKIGLATLFAAGAKAVTKFAKDAISQTQLIGDRWDQFTTGMSYSYNTFVAHLSSGKGWNELISNMRESYRVGKEVAAMMDENFDRMNSLSVKEADAAREIEMNKMIMRDTSRSRDERLAAAEFVVNKERELANDRKNIVQQELEARKMALLDRTDMSEAELEEYVNDYEKNRELILQAQEYSSELKRLQKNVADLEKQYYENPDVWAPVEPENLKAAKKALADFVATADKEAVRMAGVDKKYQQSNDELLSKYIEALVKFKNVDADYYRTITRSNTTIGALTNEMLREEQQKAENAFRAEIDGVDKHQKQMETKAKEAYSKGEISETQYQSRLLSIQETALKSKIAIAERYKRETVEYHSELLDMTLKQQEEFRKLLEKTEKDADEIFKKIYEDSAAELENIIDTEMEAEFDRLLELTKKAKEVRDTLDPSTALGQQMKSDMASLEEMYENRLMTEEEFQKAKQDLIKQYIQENLNLELDSWQKGMEKAQAVIEGASDMITALQDAEHAKLEARMQAELTAAGDNAEKKEEIENKYEQKKLETQKKYAVADMVINIAKTIASGALAIMRAISDLGPIAGPIAAATIGVTTAAQVASIVAQKNAIMATTAGSSGSSQIGARVATGYSSGGYTTKAHNDYQEVGIVHANEWVAPAAMVRANPIVFRRLEQARKKSTPISGVSGFADGGMTSPSANMTSPELASMDPALIAQLVTVLKYIIDNGIPAYVLLSEINSQQELRAYMKNITGKK